MKRGGKRGEEAAAAEMDLVVESELPRTKSNGRG